VKSAEIAEIERIFVAAEHFDRKSERAMNRRFALSRAVLILAVVAAFTIYLFVGLVAPCMVLIDLTHSEETPLGTRASILTGGVMFGWLIFWTWLISSNPRIEDLGDRIEAWSDGFNDCGRGDLAARGRNVSLRGGEQRVVGRLRERARRLERFERVGILFPSHGRSLDLA